MKIDCVPTSGSRSFLTVTIDEEEWKQIHTSIFGYKPSLPKDCSTPEEFSKKFEILECKQAKLYAIKRLSMQSMPSAVLANALKQRLVSETTITTIIEECQSLGYLNDAEWTKSFVRCQVGRKLGPRSIAQKLSAKGLSRENVAEAVQASGGEEQQKISIKQLLATRYKKRNLKDFKEKQKVIAALMRRGFDFSVIIECLPRSGWECND